MPKATEQPNYLPLIIIAVIGVWWWNGRTHDVPKPPVPDDQHNVDPQPVVNPAESEYWSAIALCVDKSSFGVQQQHTDHLLQIVDILKTNGSIKDDARVSEWRAKRIEITDANRAEISKQLRGK